MSWPAWSAVARAGRRLASSADGAAGRGRRRRRAPGRGAGRPVRRGAGRVGPGPRRGVAGHRRGGGDAAAAARRDGRHAGRRGRRGHRPPRVVRRAGCAAAGPGDRDGPAAHRLPVGPGADPPLAGDVPAGGDLRDPRGDRLRRLHPPARGARRPAAAGLLPRPGRGGGRRGRLHHRRRRGRHRRQAGAPAPARLRGPGRHRRRRGERQLGAAQGGREGPRLGARRHPAGTARARAGRQDRRPGRPGRRRARRRRTGWGSGCWRSSSRRAPPARTRSRRCATPCAGSPTPSAPRRRAPAPSSDHRERVPDVLVQHDPVAVARVLEQGGGLLEDALPPSSGTNLQNIRCPVPIVQARQCSASSKTTGSVSRTVRTSRAPAAVAISAIALVAAERGVDAAGARVDQRRREVRDEQRVDRPPGVVLRPEGGQPGPAAADAAAGASRAATPPAAAGRTAPARTPARRRTAPAAAATSRRRAPPRPGRARRARAAARVCATIAGETSRAVTEPVLADGPREGERDRSAAAADVDDALARSRVEQLDEPVRDRREERHAALVVVVGDGVEDPADAGHQLGGRRWRWAPGQPARPGACGPWPGRAVRVRPPRRALPGSAPRRR